MTILAPPAEEQAQLPREQVGTITLSLYRSGRASLSSGLKTTATGFHTKTTPDVNALVKTTTVDGLYSKSHATGCVSASEACFQVTDFNISLY